MSSSSATSTSCHVSIVEGYMMRGRLGAGAYGEVYLVTRRQTANISAENNDGGGEDQVAMYAMKRCAMRSNDKDEGIPQNVLREVSALMALKRFRHPNVVLIHDAFVTNTALEGKRLNIVFEKCDWDLQTFLHDIPHDMSDWECRLFARQIFTGLDFLHSHSIVHRDLKTQNILVNRGQIPCLKIADFGLARSFGLHSTFTPISVTLTYRAPEVLLQTSYGTAVDIWSAGCILIELYTRAPLFDAQPATEANQILVIFRSLGTPSASLWPEGALIEHSFYPNYPPVPLQRLAPKASEHAVELANETLKYNPLARPTASECLQHPYFVRSTTTYRLP